jgi:transposase-like protein
MTQLEKQLAQTFRAVRWSESGGNPVCPDCFDGEDLAKPLPDPLTPGLSRYHCTVCTRMFSDVRGTVFATRTPVSLTLWAYLVLLGDPRRIEGITAREIKRCYGLVAVSKFAPLRGLWQAQMTEAGLTVERLRRALARYPEAA